MKEITIDCENENQRLDKFLLKYFNKANKSFIYKMLRKKNIKYNNNKACGNEILKAQDTIQIYFCDETINNFRQTKEVDIVKKTFDIIYEDKNILICNKPAGLLVQRENSYDTNTLVDQVVYYLYQKGEYTQQNGFKPAICNRLDRNTSGIVIAGKNLMSLQAINKCIHDNNVQKFYKAIVKGDLTDAGFIQNYQIKDRALNKVKVLDTQIENSKKAITKYKPIKSNGEFTLVEIELITGRTHQIRSHLANIGYPIIGDLKYGDLNISNFFNRKYKLEYQFLYAYKIIFKDVEDKLSYLNNQIFEATPSKLFKSIQYDLFKI